MKFVLIISNWNYAVIDPYLSFINDNFENKEHVFLVLDYEKNIPNSIINHRNVTVIGKIERKLSSTFLKYLYSADGILIHGLPFNTFHLLQLTSRTSLFSKIC